MAARGVSRFLTLWKDADPLNVSAKVGRRAITQTDVRLRVVGEFWGGTSATDALIAELGLTERVEIRPSYAPADEVGAAEM